MKYGKKQACAACVSLLTLTAVAASAQTPQMSDGQAGSATTEVDDADALVRPAWKWMRYQEDWSSFRDVPRDQLPWYEAIKAIPLSDDGSTQITFGGHTRARFEAFNNFAFGAPAVDSDEFLLWRAKLHADLRVGDSFRVFVEGKSALSTDRDLPGGNRTLDVDSFELQQAFVDLSFQLNNNTRLTIRPGRQELTFGKQRLVSPLPWGNTIRSWDGVSALLSTTNFKAHAFWTQFVPVRKYDFNTAEATRDFYGIYTTSTLGPVGLDLYYLGFQNNGVVFNGSAGNEERHTVGGRLFGKFGDSDFDYDFEGAFQFGRVGAADVSAFMIGSQIGWKPSDAPWSPRFYVGFDYGSGDKSPGGDVETFNQLFPLGHAFLGYIDIVGRQNIVDVSVGVKFSPAKKIAISLDGHFFYRAENTDALYNAGGGVVRAGGGSSSNDVGTELDLTVKWSVNRHLTTQVGYSHFFAGDFLNETGAGDDISFFYTQVIITF